jgi:hypothetical protein
MSGPVLKKVPRAVVFILSPTLSRLVSLGIGGDGKPATG